MTAGTSARVGTWTVLADRTSATFTVRNFGFRVVHGSIPVELGSVRVSADGVVAVEAALDLDKIDTGNAKRDADLRKPGLLAIDAHPVLTFAADRIEEGPDGWLVEGTLGARGESCPLTVTATGPADDGDGTWRVLAGAVFDRRAIGLRAPRFLIGREITIALDVVLAPPG
ncbi:YceI family protein [Amycolatopsis keratiniphila]|uniref:YceI family protein n=1 Tax=Amycolatopsis keratiniphila TaxID=129921 RepID=R4TBN6_9PSEU|nr:YceI family protein [Amycolatopsis keratiniphila]AGM07868.1 YceI family protein [Amycolatopsis keratiniphila]